MLPAEPNHATPPPPTRLDYRAADPFRAARRRRAAFWFAVAMMALPTAPFVVLILIAILHDVLNSLARLV